MEKNPILQNTIGGGHEWRGGKRIMAALTPEQKQGAGGGNTGWSALMEAVKMFWPAVIT